MKILKNRLPHWVLEGACYMLTFRLMSGSLTKHEKMYVLDHIRSGHKKFYNLVAAQIMPDHVHIILSPNDGYDISRIVKGIKGITAREINRMRTGTGHLWEKDYFDRIIRNESDFQEKLKYIYENPLKTELTDDCGNYDGWYLQTD